MTTERPDHPPDDEVEPLIEGVPARETFSFFGRQKEQTLPPLTGIDPGRVIDDFRLIALLGQGGMGQVWEAEQVSLNRRVALKLVRPDRVNEHTLDLFSREARAGGRLHHSGIVTVHGHGVSEGIAWIAMELVEGAWTLKDFIEEIVRSGELPEGYYRRIAELVSELADALQAAHEANVIHRDLKPGNVLITPDEHLKVTDFGLAKITDETALSVTGDFAGTYAYMSPEQAMAKRMGIDHRTDVFSLGIMFYELLALRRPFEGDTSVQVTQQIVTEDPVDLRRLRSRIPLDLAVIAGKCLEKSPDRRYQTMEEMATDIRRHLASEPILAKPASVVQRAAKWVLRHRIGVSVAAAGVLVTLVFAVTMAIQAGRIGVQRDRAEAERQSSETVSKFLENTLSDVDPQRFGATLIADVREQVTAILRESGASDQQIRETLDALTDVNATNTALMLLDQEVLARAGKTIQASLAAEPLTAARLEHTLGSTYHELGLYERASSHLQRALEIREEELGEDDPQALETLTRLADVYEDNGLYPEAESLFLKVLEKRLNRLGDEHPDTLAAMTNLAIVYESQGRYNEAERLFSKVVGSQTRLYGRDSLQAIGAMNNLGVVYKNQSLYEEAEALLVEAVEVSKRTLGDEAPETLDSMNNLALLYKDVGRYGEAESLCVRILATRRRKLGDDHPRTLSSIGNLAGIYWVQERDDEAEPLYRESLAVSRRVLGNRHAHTLRTMSSLSGLQAAQGRFDEAEPLMMEALESQKRVLGTDHPETLSTIMLAGVFYSRQRRYAEAEVLFVEALQTQQRALGDEHADTIRTMGNLAIVYKNQGRFAEAETMYLNSLGASERSLGPTHPVTFNTLYNLACFEAARGRTAKGLDWLRQSVERGFSSSKWMTQDTDLVPLHGPKFDALVDIARHNAAEGR